MNSSSIVLDLASWVDGGCPITSFVVEYQKIRAATTKSEMVSSGNSKSDSSLSKEVTISVHEDHYTGQLLKETMIRISNFKAIIHLKKITNSNA